MPQPIMACNAFWFWGMSQRAVLGIPFRPQQRGMDVDQPLAAQVAWTAQPTYANSLAFDGVHICFICDDRFYRVSMYDGSHVGKKVEHISFRDTQKAAPTIITVHNPSNRYRPFKYWITPLRQMILIVDITTVGEEAFHLVPWQNEDGADSMRSPVLFDNQIYMMTELGNVYRMPLADGLHPLLEKSLVLEPISRVKDHYIFAPMVIGYHLVFETLTKEPKKQPKQKYKEDWHEVAIGSMNLATGEVLVSPPVGYERRSFLKQYGHLAGFSDGEKAYYAVNRKDVSHVSCVPGQRPMEQKLNWPYEASSSPPSFHTNNALMVGKQLCVYDSQGKRVIFWDLDSRTMKGTKSGVGGTLSDATLYAQPIVFGNILALMHKDRVSFASL